VVGGNLTASRSGVIIDVALFGYGDRLLLRSGAMPGDLLVVTGTLGAAAAGIHGLREGGRLFEDGTLAALGRWKQSAAESLLHCLRAQLDPAPPLAFGRSLAEQELAHAAMDVSDGLSGDLLSLCELGDVSARIDSSAVPVDARAAELEKDGGPDGFSLAIHGGEDYQLLMAVPADRLDALRDLAIVWDVPLSVVGEIAAGPPSVSLKFGDEIRRLKPRSFDHFADPIHDGARDPAREA
jgi:thiamine-monophosphate kinase